MENLTIQISWEYFLGIMAALIAVGWYSSGRFTTLETPIQQVKDTPDTLMLEPEFEDKLKKFAYEKGTSMPILRRVGAIYFRNLCLEDFGMNEDDINKHDPQINNNDPK